MPFTKSRALLPSRGDWPWPVFSLLVLFQLWAAHALAFFAHEYAHSFTAWLLGWKANPFALNYAHPTALVFLAQLGINQNVNELPIFAGGHGHDAALIAAAGMVIGNGLISYALSRLGLSLARRHGRRGFAMLFYWTTVASIGNFIDYVPIRTFSPEGDMDSLERGFGWSPWLVLLVLGIPTALALVDFLARLQPDTLAWLFPESAIRRFLMALLTGGVLFGFYGSVGLLEGGPTAHRMSIVSVTVLLPLVTALSLYLVRPRAAPELSS